ncbi:MAG: radical SAM/SPASM domain-containing protein [Planctomycetota bacterium]|jgi:MoaA/NifB/PqqE/SkfB family radical SAM enzyme
MASEMSNLGRLVRHARISWRSFAFPVVPLPSFLIFFINSICNLKCEHCFYWRNLNRPDDLSLDEIFFLSDQLGRIDNLNLSGGEPFLRKEIAEICRYFIRNNQVKQIYVPTNAYFIEKTTKAVKKILMESTLSLFAVEISLDGMQDYHNKLRGSDSSFQRALETYDALADLQKSDSRLRIHAVSTVHEGNMDEVRNLTRFLYKRCPAMDHHNIALIRGDRKNPTLQGPQLKEFQELYAHVQKVWANRENGRFGRIVEPMLQWTKVRTAEEQQQIVPCRAGILSAVVYSNGDVSFCETLPPLGNLREMSFKDIWYSSRAQELRKSISKKDCYCTNEMFLWPSIAFQPWELGKALWHAKPWKA